MTSAIFQPQAGYYRFPTVQGDRVVFVCEDDLWSVPRTGGTAIRLTSNLGEVSHPFLSPDGSQLAFVGREEGQPEIYLMPASGGMAQRLTFLGANSWVVGWSPNQTILFASNSAQPFWRLTFLYHLSPQGGLPDRLPVGAASHISYQPGIRGSAGGVVLGRNTSDLARWKRYRGGRTGQLWIDRDGNGEFCSLLHLPGNLTDPMWIGDRIYFLSDHEGLGNLYSCTPSGDDVRGHTQHQDYYLRHATTDGHHIVYHGGANLFCFDPATDNEQPIPVEFHSPQVQRQRKFVDATRYLETYALHPEGHSVLLTSRGKSFWFGNWEGAVTQLGVADGVRYRLTDWLSTPLADPESPAPAPDGSSFVTLSDREGVEAIEIHTGQVGESPKRLEGLDIGRALAMKVSPVAAQVVLSNHRHELVWVDLANQTYRIIDRSPYGHIAGFAWSADGQWVAYGCATNRRTSVIKLYHLADETLHTVTEPRFWDYNPSFDPDGKYLYFLSYREFNPVYDGRYFDLGFPRGVRPFLLTLKADLPSPFIPVPKPLVAKKKDKSHSSSEANESNGSANGEVNGELNGDGSEEEPSDRSQTPESEPLAIDLEGIQHRITCFPVPEGRYYQVWGLKNKVLFTSFPIRGSLNDSWQEDDESTGTLEVYDFDKQSRETIASGVRDFAMAQDGETLIYRAAKQRLRVCTVKPQKNDNADKPGRTTGWLDLNRVRISVVPALEWQQMFREAWRLQTEQFWVEDMSGVDWQRAYDRYRPLLDRVTTRSEFSDLIWELQGELGTSHAYESGGDYRRSPHYPIGFLAADFSYDDATDAYRIEHLARGDAWNPEHDSPLHRLGCNVQVGDLLLAVGGQRLGADRPPQAYLVHQAEAEVTLTVQRPSANGATSEPRTITVKTLKSDRAVRYREWVERNRAIVQARSDGRVGYLHVPDMGPMGYAEFHRYYLAEVDQEGLIVDVRYNGGGNVSQLLLEKLARRPISYKVSRWRQPYTYPMDAVQGAIVALTNEHAGSDGDIFSHCFKLMGLGPLIGKRTWGGVIGISPRHWLVDGGRLTQPEFASWFPDVGWGVENYGTDPDIEVDIRPQDWAVGADPQLDRAIQIVLDQLTHQPVKLPEFGDRPLRSFPSPPGL